MNVLNTITEAKRIEVAEKKQTLTIEHLKDMPLYPRQCLSLKENLTKSKTGVIAEFKRRSPSKGIINADAMIEDVSKGYTVNGASGISVLTDRNFFGGGLDDLLIARVNEIPILRKEFIINEYQLYESKAYGADVILLIAACLTPAQVSDLSGKAKELGMEVLLEIHSKDELSHICESVDIIGINNRDLKSFEVDINKSIELATLIPQEFTKISESGINDPETIKVLRSKGFNGFLIGESFMKEKDPVEAFRLFMEKIEDGYES